MKRLLFIVPFLFVMGCGFANHDFLYRSYKADEVIKTSVGSVMVYAERGVKNDVYKAVMSGIRQELWFMGVENNILNVQYREYYYDAGVAYIRDKFTQNLRYDLSKGKTVRWETLELEVISTEDNMLTFKVIGTKQG